MCLLEWGRATRLFVVAAALAAYGCGGESPTPPKTNLTDQEKQQLKELDEQRQQEWGRRK